MTIHIVAGITIFLWLPCLHFNQLATEYWWRRRRKKRKPMMLAGEQGWLWGRRRRREIKGEPLCFPVPHTEGWRWVVTSSSWGGGGCHILILGGRGLSHPYPGGRGVAHPYCCWCGGGGGRGKVIPCEAFQCEMRSLVRYSWVCCS